MTKFTGHVYERLDEQGLRDFTPQRKKKLNEEYVRKLARVTEDEHKAGVTLGIKCTRCGGLFQQTYMKFGKPNDSPTFSEPGFYCKRCAKVVQLRVRE